MDVQYADVEVPLTGTDGNAFAIIGSVARALRLVHGEAAASAYVAKASAVGSYDGLLALTMQTVQVQ